MAGIQREKTGQDGAHIIVLGGDAGAGKTTIALHIAIALLRLDYRVATIDLDTRTHTLTRAAVSRMASRRPIPHPGHSIVSGNADFFSTIRDMSTAYDFIVVDTADPFNSLSMDAHGLAGTLVTPLPDTLAGLNLLGHADRETHSRLEPSAYTTMVEERNVSKIECGEKPIHWIVMRNRISSVNTEGKRLIGPLLGLMERRFGFQLVTGFSERILLRDMTSRGLTLLDLKAEDGTLQGIPALAARQEVRTLIRTIAPEKMKGYAHLQQNLRTAL